MSQPIADYIQHFKIHELSEPMFRVIDGLQNEEDKRKRVAALVMTTLMVLDSTIGIHYGLQAGTRAMNNLKALEDDRMKAIRDYVAQEIVK